MGYLYSGIERIVLRRVLRRIGLFAAATTVSLITATSTGSSHVAVWMGASTSDARNWVQAGIEQSAGDSHPWEYIEIGKGGIQRSLREWPTTYRHKAHIRLLHRGNLWKITIDTHTSPWVWLPGGRINTLALLERYVDGGIAHGTATINGKRVSG